jgi:hypothetical protein
MEKDNVLATTMAAADYVRIVKDVATIPLSENIAAYHLAEYGPLNYKITPTVTINNLTVALKHLDGTDPSAANPLIIKIGDTWHAITAALSVTKNAATNWCNAGSAELATKEADYFVYLGYNATDGVVLGFSRIPYANLYSDFSATTTNEKYAAISTITNAAAGDNYVNIGRFAATLSAGAGYTWSVPTFTSANLVQRPIFETRLLSWNPTITADSGTPTTVSNTCSYKILNLDIEYLVSVTVTAKGTAIGNINLTYPFLVAVTQSSGGRENGATGAAVCAKITSSVIGLSLYSGATLWVDTYNPSVLIKTDPGSADEGAKPIDKNALITRAFLF